MLDGVDTDTTYTDLIWDRIEAVRFKTDFVARAAKDLRTTLALESMLSLAREIGLCTLGDDPLPEGARVSGRYDFSYVPVVLGSDESDPPRSDATSLESPGHRVAPKSQAALRYP